MCYNSEIDYLVELARALPPVDRFVITIFHGTLLPDEPQMQSLLSSQPQLQVLDAYNHFVAEYEAAPPKIPS